MPVLPWGDGADAAQAPTTVKRNPMVRLLMPAMQLLGITTITTPNPTPSVGTTNWASGTK